MKYLKTNDPDFVRDANSTALINTNVRAYIQYKEARANKKQVHSNEEELKNLKNEVDELRSLVKMLLREKNG